MARMTIDYGIDLGTTNSTIAFLDGTRPEVVSDIKGSAITPSAIWIDRRGNLRVGEEARSRSFEDKENAATEFKLQMGDKTWRRTFERSGRKMLPEELSAEVLKELKKQVLTKRAEEITAAVITVPAAFEVPQCEATRRAAELAGLTLSPLLQEPVAAAMAYGFQSSNANAFWLVYDFGGGTFDAAVIQVRDNTIQVVNHAGDNFLGGKNIDWDIVDKLLVPRLTKQYALTGFTRQNSKWRAAFAKLKMAAEDAKIAVSTIRKPQEIYCDNLCQDDNGDPVELVYELAVNDLQALTEPWIAQSISLCRRALEEKGLSPSAVEKTILVGGSSLLPWLHDQLMAELGTNLEFSMDPVTVVARGAAVFAGTQRVVASPDSVAIGTYALQLVYEPVGSESDPMIGGKITPPAGQSVAGLTVEITEAQGKWRSGSVRVSSEGAFTLEIHGEKGQRWEYEIQLTDARGRRVPCVPDRFCYTYTSGAVSGDAILTHDISIALANGKSYPILRKGETLPARGTVVCQAVTGLRRAQPASDSNVVRIPILEGENLMRADRNNKIGWVEILPNDTRVRRDVPLGADIEVTLEIDASRTVKSKAFIPMLDEEFHGVFRPEMIRRRPEILNAELEDQMSRLSNLEDEAAKMGDEKAISVLDRLYNEDIPETVNRQIAAAQGDAEAVLEADRKLSAFKTRNDEIEDALHWPKLQAEARDILTFSQGTLDAHGTPADKQQAGLLCRNLTRALENGQVAALQEHVDAVRDLTFAVLVRQDGWWIEWFTDMESRRDQMTDQASAARLLTQGRKGIEAKDIEMLKVAVRQLYALLPPSVRAAADKRGAFGSTVLVQQQ